VGAAGLAGAAGADAAGFAGAAVFAGAGAAGFACAARAGVTTWELTALKAIDKIYTKTILLLIFIIKNCKSISVKTYYFFTYT